MKQNLVLTAATYLCLILGISYSHAATLYCIQIASTPDPKVADSLKRELTNLKYPFYTTELSKDGTKTVRFRIGPFSDQQSATRMSAFVGRQDVWITKEIDSVAARKPVITSARIDTFSCVPIAPSVYLSKNRRFIAVYSKQFGFEASVLPSRMKIYLENLGQSISVGEVTGFTETESAIVLGIPKLVEKNEEGVSPTSQKALSFAKNLGIDPQKAQFSFFADSSELRLNHRTEIGYGAATLQSRPALGFDYVEQNGTTRLWTGRIEGKSLGNSALKDLNCGASANIAHGNLLFYSRPVDGSDGVVVCVLAKGD